LQGLTTRMSLGTRPGADFDSAAAPPGARVSSGLNVSCALAAADQIAGAPSDNAYNNVSKAYRETRIVGSRCERNLASRHERCNKRYLCYFDRKMLYCKAPAVVFHQRCCNRRLSEIS
jgi:hypothetical protein